MSPTKASNAMTDFNLENYLAERVTAVNAALDGLLPEPEPERDPGRLREAMRYAVLQGGKRMRPLLTIACCEAVGGEIAHALPAGCALEMIHAYSLVHDDLPAMDNDLERRGKPTVHVEFGHGNAILVGDALLTAAFSCLAGGSQGVPRTLMADAVMVLAKHSGIDGMVGGQALDLEEGQDIPNLERLERVHALKTGGLFAAAGALGALAGQAEPAVVAKLERLGLAFGVAFQHADDILDDDQPALRQAAAVRIRELTDECREIASAFGEAARPLTSLADWIDERAARARAGEDLA